MDGNEDKTDGSFLKIGTIWSEAEGNIENIENITIKEEIISDLEPECILSIQENDNSADDKSFVFKMADNDQEKSDSNFINEKATLMEPLLKKPNFKNIKLINEQTEEINNSKSTCSCNSKNFKIVKKRLRCGECRSLICPECCKVMITTLQSHLSGSDGNTGFYICKICQLVFHSLCSLQAHTRIHTMNTPYVCPDCGLVYNNIYFLILHLINKCYHVYKIVRYKCKNCPGVYFEPDKFLLHIEEQHIKFLSKCSFCSSAFTNSEEFNNHVKENHQNEKMQCLNYFHCSLCSNMVLPRFMFEKHITQHRNSSQSFDIEYQCLCGYIYTLIGTFRAHILHCKKKGLLPPHWSFLQKNLKSQELPQMEILKTKKEIKLNVIPKTYSESQSKKLSSLKSLMRDKDVKEKMKNIESSLNLNSDIKNMSNKNSKILKPSETLSLTNNQNINEKSESNINKNENYTLTNTTSSNDLISSHPEILSEVEDMNLSAPAQNIQIGPENEENKSTEKLVTNDTAVVNVERANRNPIENQVIDYKEDQDNADSSKNLYGHIPCDHLGYVKTLVPETNKKEVLVCDPLNSQIHLEKKVSDYRIVTELDEKTGLISTKKVPSKDLEEESVEEIFEDETESCDLVSAVPKINNSDKTKLKLGSSFFTCPFCIVLFPKHNSTFQQFKLHVESYHPDAALNITLNQNENKNPIKTFSTTLQTNEVQEDKESIDTLQKTKDCIDSSEEINSQSGSKKSSLKYKIEANNSKKSFSIAKKKGGNLNIDLVSSKECSAENSQDSEENEISKEHNKKDHTESNLSDESESRNLTREPEKAFRTYVKVKEKNPCWTLKLSLQRSDNLDEENQQEASNKALDSDNNFNETEKIQNEKINLSEDSSEAPTSTSNFCEGKNFKTYSKKVGQINEIGSKENNSQLDNESRKCETFNIHNNLESFTFSDNKNEQSSSLEDFQKAEHSNSDKSTEKKFKKWFFSENEMKQLTSEIEEDLETSKETDWSGISIVPIEESKINEMVIESKEEEKEKSKREGEVWSQFYESLMLAERLKNSKERKQSIFAEEKKKSSVMPDYSSKRVVKKPKRYRESSESDGSIIYYNSESDTEILLPNDFVNVNDCQTEETGNVEPSDDLSTKKQKLLKKLQNVDAKFLDYLFDLVNKKEKCLELYKKHSTLRASRYRQNLRSYRKKVLNGIKHGGKSHKLLRYQELLKKRNPMMLEEDKNFAVQEGSCQRLQRKSLEGLTEIAKTGERKRGRPRKIVDPAKIKERRRSDKEKDFIEKNFAREESDASPSKRKRKLSSKLQYYKKINLSDEKEDFSSGQVITNKPVDSNKKFSCAVCKEIFQEMADFREHILVHRLEENSYQCMECGECFVVRPSLEKHLHAFHKIKNTDKYITENKCSNVKKEATEPENEPLKENQCKVCKDQFDRPIDLTKHFRIHGMAFLREFKKEGKTKL